MLKSLLPIKLSRDDSAYQTVDELAEVLRHATSVGDIKNIALTGPFGSGKSSVLHTLMENHKEFHFLPISLATLQANQEDKEDAPKKMNEEEIQFLNKKIEYSILQQIIYKEKDEVVTNSRFRRIIHIDKESRKRRALFALAVILSGIILFFQNFTKSLLEKLHIEQLHTSLWLYIPAAIIFLVGVYCLLKYFVKTYANSKLNKLNLKDGEIGVVDDESIFNKHLDEILYFFQVTDYQVVVLEDLDRFETENIFLKLRELNQLINESKIVGRPIVFIYAIKDDIFHDESRTKFFDYITTIIPVINPSNSKDKLKSALKERGFAEDEISDDDLSEMAFFIQDMRILTNIANEYSQYREKLYETSKKRLSLTKLLAMIVYKNYFPRDFAKLHKRDGHVYECINSKQKLIPEALKVLEKQENDLGSTQKTYENNRHLKENDLRLLFLYGVREALGKPVLSIQLNDNSYSLEAISLDEKLFNELLSQEEVHYTTYLPNRNYRGFFNEQPTHTPVDFNAISKKMNFDERIALLKDGENTIVRKISNLQKERLNIQKLTLSVLIKKYNLGETKAYKDLKLAPLMDVFVRLGYIDEDYYDYISYFYPEMLSEGDRDLLLSIKRQIKEKYNYHLDNIDNFVKELKDYMFDHDAILNNELLDYFARKRNGKWKDQYMLMMMRLEREENAPLDFLAQYYQLGKQQKEVFTEFIAWDKELSWKMIASHTNHDEQMLLQEAWLRYCSESIDDQTGWLNKNYSFLSERVDSIGITQCERLLPPCHFALLDNNSPQLLDMVIKFSCYEINTANVCIILNHINKNNNASEENLTMTRITDSKNTEVVNYIKHNFAKSFNCLSAKCKEESKENIIYILNSDAISEEQTIEYLTGQQCIDSFKDINEDYWTLAIQAKVISPTWQNVSAYSLKIKGVDDYLISYIEHNHTELEEVCDDNIKNKEYLFKQLLGTKKLSIPAFQSICKAMDNVFDDYEALDMMDSERLMILLNDNKIAFSETNIGIIQSTNIYANYLIHFAKDFIANLAYEYNLDSVTALALMRSNVFSASEKCKISEIIDDKVVSESSKLAEVIIDNVLTTNNATIAQEKAVVLLKSAQDERLKVNLSLLLLSGKKPTDDKIGFFILLLLESLGGIYKEIAERQKRPVLSRSDWNIALLNRLQDLDYISSTKEIKDGIRVYPKRK